MSQKSNRYSAEQVREMYLLAVDVPKGKTRWAHQAEVASTYGCSIPWSTRSSRASCTRRRLPTCDSATSARPSSGWAAPDA